MFQYGFQRVLVTIIERQLFVEIYGIGPPTLVAISIDAKYELSSKTSLIYLNANAICVFATTFCALHIFDFNW